MTLSGLCLAIFLIALGIFDCKAQKLDADPSKLPNNGICESMDIKWNIKSMEALRNCSIIVGYLRMSLLDDNSEAFKNYKFPELREVTQYVLFFRVMGLESIGQLFPNLVLIRGQKLFDNFALVIYELMQLKELGLRALTVIQRGYVKISGNPQLCYSETVNWTAITGRSLGHKFGGNGPDTCPGMESCRGCNDFCWSSKFCQRFPSQKCHPECLGGCKKINTNICYGCKNFIDNGVCVSSCPSGKVLHPTAHICMTKELCKKMYRGNGWTWNDTCIARCPKNYKYKEHNNERTCEYCGNNCNVTCPSSDFLTFAEVQNYKGCNIVNGSLHIRFGGDHANNSYNEDVMQELTDNFQDIREIKGYLKVFRSNSITSLSFLKNLVLIGGHELMNDRYSFIVHEMNNLRTLWNWNEKPKITVLKGTLFFHYNAKLCLKEIEKLKNATNTTVNELDVSTVSNGYETHCHFVTIKTESKVLGPYSVQISWDRIIQPFVDNTKLGYLIYYLEEPDPEELTHFARDTCYDKGWRIKYVEEPTDPKVNRLYENLTDLNPYTEYAFYVETYYKASFMKNESSLQDGQSEIQHFKTDMDDPMMPLNLEATALSSGSIFVTWEDDPAYTGVITHYLVEAELQYDSLELLDVRNYCLNPPNRDISLPNKRKPYIAREDTSQTKQSKGRKCSCTREAWHKYMIDHGLIHHINKTEPDNDISSLCKKFDLNVDLDNPNLDNGQEFLSLIRCKMIWSKLNIFDNETIKNSHLRLERNVGIAEMSKILNAPKTIKEPLKNMTENKVYKTFSSHFINKHRNYTLMNLQHYGKYLISIAACRTKGDNDDCGSYAVIASRTMKDPSQDKVDNLFVKILNATLIEIHWTEPKNPNGAILYYTVEYKRVDIDESRSILKCVTRKEHEQNAWKHLFAVEPGRYVAKVRAHSLAHDSEYSISDEFSTITWTHVSGWVLFFLFSLLIATCISVILFWIYKKRTCRRPGEIVFSHRNLRPRSLMARFNRRSEDDSDVFLFSDDE